MTIPKAVKELLAIVERLRARYPKKRFTLDGRLVGDLGEVLAAQVYAIALHDGLKKHHDATGRDGRLVQIKATMQDAVTFPADHIPDYYLAIKIHEDGSITEYFNGPGRIARKTVRDRRRPKTNLHSISLHALAKLNATVPEPKRIPGR